MLQHRCLGLAFPLFHGSPIMGEYRHALQQHMQKRHTVVLCLKVCSQDWKKTTFTPSMHLSQLKVNSACEMHTTVSAMVLSAPKTDKRPWFSRLLIVVFRATIRSTENQQRLALKWTVACHWQGFL